MDGLNAQEYAVLYALMQSEDAAPLAELSRRVEVRPADVGNVLDGLLNQDILECDTCYHEQFGELGEIVYPFARKTPGLSHGDEGESLSGG